MVSAAPEATRRISRTERSDQTRELFARLAEEQDPTARGELVDKIVRLNIRVANAVAGRYSGRGVDRDDLQQAACHGLVKAVLHFDPTMGKDFLTYAVPTIRGEVQRYFRDVSWTIRPPRRIQELQWRVNECIDRLSGELGREPTEAEVIDDIGITYEEYASAITAFGCFAPPSLDQPTTDAGTMTIGETLADGSTDQEAAEARVMLGPLLRSLTDDERRIVHLRFVEGWTQQQIGDEFGVAQMQVSRWLSAILRRMREQLGDVYPLAG